jgi:hypothetical protein
MMMRTAFLQPQFVRGIPEKLDPGTLYISIDFGTAAHSCCCGCGREVVTPLSPTDWKITYNGRSISLHPSIGNWNFPCQSHYRIDAGRVVWADRWSPAMIAAGRANDRHAKAQYYEKQGGALPEHSAGAGQSKAGSARFNLRSWLRGWWPIIVGPRLGAGSHADCSLQPNNPGPGLNGICHV